MSLFSLWKKSKEEISDKSDNFKECKKDKKIELSEAVDLFVIKEKGEKTWVIH